VRRENLWLAVFLLHFTLILAVSFHQILALIANGRTILPPSVCWEAANAILSDALGEHLRSSNPVRQGVATYRNAAGIERGYNFFAPSVPDNYKVVFELRYSDGRTEYMLPEVADPATGKRLGNLLDYIGHTPYEELRKILIKMLAHRICQIHPDVTMIRAIFGFVRLPSLNEYKHGRKESYEVLHVYDFEFQPETTGDTP